MSAPEEYVAAAKAAEQVGIDWAGTMSFDTAGRSMMGVTSSQLAELAAAQVPAPLAYGANCGVGASDLLRTVLGFTETDSQIPVIAKGNAGIPKFVHGHIHYDGTPELMADYAILARNCGASVIGGCCGTAPEHLQHMRRALESIPKSNKPSLSDIVEKLGPFSSDHDGTGDTQPPVRVRRRTRSSA
jgi:5-methyltetrahydrofolate--homocysteine methyltransferase